ncbi:MAG: lamin tail domain-containing protein [Bacteroidia bacterium]|jgi:hypothetical protein
MKPKLTLLFFLTLASWRLDAQIADAFNDGNFLNPLWIGDTSSFAINSSEQMQLKAAQAGEYSVATAISVYPIQEWQCWVRNAFSPSTQNFTRIYLLSDTSNLATALNGYYIQLGGVTGNSDSITLYRQTGYQRVRIAAGRPATLGKSNNRVRLKIIRDAAQWVIYSDSSGGTQFTIEAVGYDGTPAPGTWMGMYCKTTVGNTQNFYLDDVYAGPVQIDTIPPQLTGLEILQPDLIKLNFSEPVDSIAAKSVLQFKVNPGNIHPQEIKWDYPDSKSVRLKFDSAFQNKQTYHVYLSDIRDTAGNSMTAPGIPFTFFEAQLYDVLISEWMADPSPPVDLPEQEYVELYNASGITLNLEGWTLTDGSSKATFPLCTVAAGESIIVCPVLVQSQFSGFGRAVGLNYFPSLNNTGDELILKSRLGKIIHQVNYTKEWFSNPEKAEGGWSLEMINPHNVCQGRYNYRASVHTNGGTPGQQNSIWSEARDSSAPQLTEVQVTDSIQLLLRFDEVMDSLAMQQSVWQLDEDVTILNRFVTGESRDSLWLQITPLKHATYYTLSGNGIRDCSGNTSNSIQTAFEFLQPEPAIRNDIVISEIMADPELASSLPDCEYIELFNRSDKVISLEGWTFWSGLSFCQFGKRLLKPDSFLVITSSGNEYLFSGKPVMGAVAFPALANSGAQLVLRNASGKLIFQIKYSSAWYRHTIKEKGGWSLEMRDANNACGGEENWSVSEDPTGGTPGRQNSIQGFLPDLFAPEITSIYPIDSLQLEVRFNESMEVLGLQQLSNYEIQPEIKIILASPVEPELRAVRLLLNQPLKSETVYRIKISNGADCAGNLLNEQNTYTFELPVELEAGNLAINEILFNPYAEGSDFLEVVNTSVKWIDLKNVLVANLNDDGTIHEAIHLREDGWLMQPGEYLVFAANPSDICNRYVTPSKGSVLPCELPSMNDDEGAVLLMKGADLRLDEVHYSEKMHFALLDNPEGVSLERIALNRPSNDITNWSSAASTAGYATPGAVNSQYYQAENKTGIMQVDPLVFSPDNDGYHDQVHFQFQLPADGYAGTIHIFNDAGVLVKTLLHNSLMGSNSQLNWNGLNEEGKPAASGIYIVYLEAFNLKGKVLQEKKSFALGVRF